MATALSRLERPGKIAQPRCKVAVVGFGTVGNSVARLLNSHDRPWLRLTHVCNRQVDRKKVPWLSSEIVWTEDIHEVLASDVELVVELMGGIDPAHELVSRALQSGKSVVTANKQLMARCGSELSRVAAAHGQYLGFGACVAGGVPVLSGLQDGLAGDRLVQLRGILNGTCNYILTRIEQGGVSFADALAEAQQAGFAEADPGEDIDGLDAAAKLAILARVGLKLDASLEQVECRSIRDVEAIDFEYARDLGCTIKQISIAKLVDERCYLAVEPCLVENRSPLAKVVGCENLLISTGEFGGDTLFGGRGAGGDPTAVAVVSDLLHAAQRRVHRENALDCTPTGPCVVANDRESPQYLRFVVRDRPGIIASLAEVFSRHHINLDAVLQKPGHSKSELPFVITLESCKPSQFQPALAEISRFDFLREMPVRMPILA